LLGRGALRAAAAAAAAFSASCFAARSAALLFVRGAILGGAPTLLGRGLGFAAGVAEFEPSFGLLGELGTALFVLLRGGIWPTTEEARLPTAYLDGVAATDA
jgi:hypothetical protein